MEFNLEHSLALLSRTPSVFDTLLRDLPDGWTLHNEGPDTWSPFDVIGHLIHGEKTDWMPRTRIILEHQTGRPFEPFDRFAQMNSNEGKSLNGLLDEFQELRGANVEALRSLELTPEKLALKGVHPEFGEVVLQDMLATWTVHDLGHIIQVSRVMAKQYDRAVGPWKKYLTVLHA